MATPPFNINQSLPGDTDVVAQHPTNARAMRDQTESWLLLVSDTYGRIKVQTGNAAARDALASVVNGTLFATTGLAPFTVLQRYNGASWDTIGPIAATEALAGAAEIATQAETNTGTDDARFVTPLKLTTWAPPMAAVTPDFANDSLLLIDADDSSKWKKVTITSVGSRLMQTVTATPVTANSDLTTTVPNDDTVPTITEGDQILTAAITARRSDSNFRVTIEVAASGDANGQGIVTLFKDSTAVRTWVMALLNVNVSQGTFIYEGTTADTSTHTFTVRMGGAQGQLSHVYLNGNSTTRKFGGALSCTMTIDEVRP